MYKRKQASLEEVGIVETLMAEPVNEENTMTAEQIQEEAPVMSPEEEMLDNIDLLNTSVANVGASIKKIFVSNFEVGLFALPHF